MPLPARCRRDVEILHLGAGIPLAPLGPRILVGEQQDPAHRSVAVKREQVRALPLVLASDALAVNR